MTSTFTRFVCRILAASMIVLPFQAQAGVIGTEHALAADAQGARAAVAAIVGRSEVADQLQVLGISPQEARERVAALSDAEVASLAGRIDALPAGGIPGILPVLVVLLLVYHFFIAPSAPAKDAGKAKPAPEKK